LAAGFTGLAADLVAGLAAGLTGLVAVLGAGLATDLGADLAADLEALTDLAGLDAPDAGALDAFLAGDFATGFLVDLVAMTIL
jgi:hypothetical protein